MSSGFYFYGDILKNKKSALKILTRIQIINDIMNGSNWD